MDTVSDLRRHAATAPQRCAIDCDGDRLTYGELEAMANRVASVWRGLGIVRGDHVATLLGNRPLALAAAWAAWRCGVYLTPLSTALTAHELGALLRECTVKLLIADGAEAAQAVPLPELPTTVVHWLSARGPIAGYLALEPLLAEASPLPGAHEPPGALMMTTSGTTGVPKGVIRPLLPAEWRGTPPFAADLIGLFGLGGHDVRYLSTAPLYHAAPLRCALAVTAGGGTARVMARFDAGRALGILESEGITHSQWVPAMFQRLLSLPAERRASFRAPHHLCAIHGAAPCPPALKRAMIDWWGPVLLEYYSGSEGVGLTLIDSADWLAHPGSVGQARKGTLHIVDDAGREVPAGSTGRVFFSGIAPFAYFNAPEKTAARTLPQGWQGFGDVGHVDENGYLYLTDREDDLIISGGVNLYPQEIEAAIGAVPGVWDCAVVGIDDERFGERPVAFVVPVRGTDGLALVLDVKRHCEERLGRFKNPVAIHVLAELPRSATGKLLRRTLRHLVSIPSETL